MAQAKSFNENELVKSIINDMLSNRWNICETTLEKYKFVIKRINELIITLKIYFRNSSPNLNFCNVIFSMMVLL
jgi:hypothetical protein